jgi:hypothetical protein
MADKIIEFRKALAEIGQEYTIEQARRIYKEAKKIIKNSKKLSQMDLWNLQEEQVEGMTEKEKNEAIMLYQHVRDL